MHRADSDVVLGRKCLDAREVLVDADSPRHDRLSESDRQKLTRGFGRRDHPLLVRPHSRALGQPRGKSLRSRLIGLGDPGRIDPQGGDTAAAMA
ncbi:hypothetical protein GCM10023175_45920 [Pseudonocardia xishanensis]|uniref:Uncharacterized protein n=1 Tax=Pseudonocardia xishanensis TaxID=630995 RepID=A0ABP8RXE1_9PSEU